jgi:hypothetical protein
MKTYRRLPFYVPNKKNQPQVSLVPQPEHPPFFFRLEDILNP